MLLISKTALEFTRIHLSDDVAVDFTPLAMFGSFDEDLHPKWNPLKGFHSLALAKTPIHYIFVESSLFILGVSR
jgi:hypothetical protein